MKKDSKKPPKKEFIHSLGEKDDMLNVIKYFLGLNDISSLVSEYTTIDGKKIYSPESNKQIQNITTSTYLNLKNRHNGIYIMDVDESSIDIEKDKFKKFLVAELKKHLKSLSELFPYHDFSYIKQNYDVLTFIVRFSNVETDIAYNGFNKVNLPIIFLQLEPRNNEKDNTIKTLRHEYTHFCCNGSINKKIKNGYLKNVPRFLNEGLTQDVTNQVFNHEHFDQNVINMGLQTYTINTQLAHIYITLFGDRTVYSSYFDQDMSLINKKFVELVKKTGISLDNILFPGEKNLNDFIARLNFELEYLSNYLGQCSFSNAPKDLKFNHIDKFLDIANTYFSFFSKDLNQMKVNMDRLFAFKENYKIMINYINQITEDPTFK